MTMTLATAMQKVNNSGLSENLKLALLNMAGKKMGLDLGVSIPTEEPTEKQKLSYLLNSMGPAAASSAVEFGIQHFSKRNKHNFRTQKFTENYMVNAQMIQNLDVGATGDFNNVLRQFLLPRYAYLDFDAIVDPRHMIDLECGYPRFITPIMYRYMYDRDDVARRVVDIYPDECWSADPEVYDDDDEKKTTPFEEDWKRLCDEMNLLSYLYRMDKMCGIGHYGVLLLGIDDGLPLDQPILGLDQWGRPDPKFKPQRPYNLLYMRPFDEYLSFIQMYETDVYSPRYGLPVYYNLVMLDMTIDAAGASIGTRLNRRVHWTRLIHVADNLLSSLVYGIPRAQNTFNRLLDLRKIKGGSAEMFWKGAFPGLAFEIDPRFVADDPEFDREDFKREVKDYADGLQRYLTLIGIKATSLAPQIAEPKAHVEIQEAAIAQNLNIPLRIFQGSEEGRLASSQDSLAWNTRLKKRYSKFLNPYLIRKIVDRFIALGIMRPPKDGKYKIYWPDLNLSTDEDKANLALKWTQALAQYVSSGIIHMIPPMDYMTMILGLPPSDAVRINQYVEANGGYEKLKKVDPAAPTAGGANGTRQNIADKNQSTKKDGKAKKPNTADKKATGMKSK